MKLSEEEKLTLPAGTRVPDHIALILDGNRRWARAKGLSPSEGHRAGYEAAKRVAKMARKWGIHTVTFWGFSTENWDRSPQEIAKIMDLIRLALKDVRREAHEDGVRVVHLGRKNRLPGDIVETIIELEEETRANSRHVLNWALDYGGKDEIVRATQEIIRHGVKADDVDEKLFASYLDTANQPYPYVDLFIRPSGEQRTSGLLIWQMTYAEYYWEPDHLPNFTPERLRLAILDYSRRRRRFGGDGTEKHLHFNPKVVASLELKWRHQLAINPGEDFRDLVVRYVQEHYGLSKELAKDAGLNMARAIVYRKQKNWRDAKLSLEELYKIIQKTLRLAFEPEAVAKFEVDLWRKGESESGMRQFLAEKFRVSDLQASKSAHLAYLANVEMTGNNWKQAKWYLERYYQALKERVA